MNWQPIAAGIIPSIAVGLIFWYSLRAILRADRNERAALAAADAARDAELLAQDEPASKNTHLRDETNRPATT